MSYANHDVRNHDALVVTASVDNIDIYDHLTTDQDFFIIGYPAFVGTSSILIKLEFW